MRCAASVVIAVSVAACAHASSPPFEPTLGASTAGGPPPIAVLTQQTCPPDANGCDILEIVDVHTSATSEDKGFDELRRLATARGGDAVIGAEFEHGDTDQLSHLSGMIVSYGRPVPPHIILGEIEVASDPDEQDKGLAELAARGSKMGGDQVIDVTFEHGEDGAQGHLRGRVVRFTR